MECLNITKVRVSVEHLDDANRQIFILTIRAILIVSGQEGGSLQTISYFLHPVPDSGANEQNMTLAQQQKAAPGRAERRLLMLLSQSHVLRVCSQSHDPSHAHTKHTYIKD